MITLYLCTCALAKLQSNLFELCRIVIKIHGEDVVHVVRIEVVAADVAFQVELVVGSLCHILDEYGTKVHLYIRWQKD